MRSFVNRRCKLGFSRGRLTQMAFSHGDDLVTVRWPSWFYASASDALLLASDLVMVTGEKKNTPHTVFGCRVPVPVVGARGVGWVESARLVRRIAFSRGE